MVRRIGIYSGTFDPVHAGHIAFASASRQACQLDEVVFLPEKQPHGKQNVTALSHRKILLEKAIEHTPRLRVVELSSHQFTVQETLPELRQRFGDAELILLIGSDVVSSLPYWPDIHLLLDEIPLAIGMRIGDSRQQIHTTLKNMNITPHPTFICTDFSDLTSSQVRSGKTPHFKPAITEYASSHALYAPLT